MKTILYISTNLMWSGSEELWTRSAKDLIKQGNVISFITRYNHPELEKIPATRIILNQAIHQSLFIRSVKKVAEKVLNKNLTRKFIQQEKPHLVIISQGNNYDSIDVMQQCLKLQVPYITITQLVGEIFVGMFVNERLPILQECYLKAKRNYFVSNHNLELNNVLLGVKLANAEKIYNPCKLIEEDVTPFPDYRNEYNIALVGRLECWQKGFDLILQIADQQKWRERSVYFNIYGDGPNLELLKANILNLNIQNVVLKGHCKQVSQIWRDNQLLCMPSRMEGQALALIEAMWCHRAAVVTDVGGASELIEEGVSGFIAEAPTVKALDAALERAWEQRSKWKELGENAAACLKSKHPDDAVAYFNEQVIKHLN